MEKVYYLACSIKTELEIVSPLGQPCSVKLNALPGCMGACLIFETKEQALQCADEAVPIELSIPPKNKEE